MIWSPIIIAVIIIAVIIALKILSFSWKVISLIFTTIIILSIVFSLIVYIDNKNFSQKFSESEKIFVLSHDDAVLAGVSGRFRGDFYKNLNSSKIENIRTEINNGKGAKIAGKGLLFVVDSSAFNESSIAGLDYKELMDILLSDNPKQKYSEYNCLSESEYSSENMKNGLFVSILGKSVDENENFLTEKINEGKIIIYPESVTTFLIKKMPKQIMNLVIKLKGDFRTQNGY